MHRATLQGGLIKHFLMIALITVFSCQTEEPTPAFNSVKFGFTPPLANSSGRPKADAEPHSIVITVEDADGVVINDEEIMVSTFGTAYFTVEDIELPVGTYTLTKFLVFDEDNNVIMAAPVVGSPKAYLVDEPLPLAFTVHADEVTSVPVEVVNVVADSDTPEDFGYGIATFSLDPVSTFVLHGLVSDRATGNDLAASVLVQGFDDAHQIKLEHTFQSSEWWGQVDWELRSDLTYYRFFVSKEGYYDLEYYFTPEQLVRGTVCCEDADDFTMWLVPTASYHRIEVSDMLKPNWNSYKYPQDIFIYVPKDGCLASWIDFGGFVPSEINLVVSGSNEAENDVVEIAHDLHVNDNLGDDFFGAFYLSNNALCSASPTSRYIGTNIYAGYGSYYMQFGLLWDRVTNMYVSADQIVYRQTLTSIEDLFQQSYDLNN
jgi:hypothetical protein